MPQEHQEIGHDWRELMYALAHLRTIVGRPSELLKPGDREAWELQVAVFRRDFGLVANRTRTYVGLPEQEVEESWTETEIVAACDRLTDSQPHTNEFFRNRLLELLHELHS